MTFSRLRMQTLKVKSMTKGYVHLLFVFTFHSFHLFMFDVRCWASISPVGCVRVSDVFFFFFDITCWASISLERMD